MVKYDLVINSGRPPVVHGPRGPHVHAEEITICVTWLLKFASVTKKIDKFQVSYGIEITVTRVALHVFYCALDHSIIWFIKLDFEYR